MKSEIIEQPVKVVAFGDSITQAVEVEAGKRWPHLLETALGAHLAPREVRVINAGVGGNTSREGLARIDAVLGHEPDIALIEFGGNDATHEEHRYVPVAEFITNLETMRSRFAVETSIVVLTFPPIVDAWTVHNEHTFHQAHGGLDRHVELYRSAARDFALQNGFPIADIDRSLRAAALADGWGTFFQKDGVHLTAAGNGVVCETVLQQLAGLQAWKK